MAKIAELYVATFASLVGETFSSKDIKVIMVTKNPTINTASLNVSDYAGVRNADNSISRQGSQAVQYAPILFEKVATGYKVLDPSEHVARPGKSGSLRGASDAQVLAE